MHVPSSSITNSVSMISWHNLSISSRLHLRPRLESFMDCCLFLQWRRLDMPRKQPSEPLYEDNVRDTSGTLGQTGDTKSPHTEEVVQHNACKDIEEDVDESNPEVPPALAVVDVACSKKLVRHREWAILTPTRGAWVVQLSRRPSVEVLCEILRASLAGWGVEDGHLYPRALDATSVQACACPARDLSCHCQCLLHSRELAILHTI